MTLELHRTDYTDPRFVALVEDLDAELAKRDGPAHDFYDQFNGIEGMNTVLLACVQGQAIGCGALKRFDADRAEMKRMYVAPPWRRRGVAVALLRGLHQWARELGYAAVVLETGRAQPEAIALYERAGYRPITNFPPYVGVENSLCFERQLEHPRGEIGQT